MKCWKWCLAAVGLVAALGKLPFSGTDVAKLQPVQVVLVSRASGQILVETDTGDAGVGQDLDAAFEDLKRTASGEVFLETAENLLVTSETVWLLDEISNYLRPGCSICRVTEIEDLSEAAKYLSAHEPKITLRDYRSGDRRIPQLQSVEGRLCLVQS